MNSSSCCCWSRVFFSRQTVPLIIAMGVAMGVAGCGQKAIGPPPRYAVLRFENLSGDAALEWTGRAASEVFTRTLSGALDGPVLARTALARLSGVLVQRMVPHGRETIVGITRDPEFGPLLMFGLGGILVEALGDVVFRIPPVDDAQATDMLALIRGAKILDGVRGEKPVDRQALAAVLRRVGQLAVDFPAILELYVNPLLAFPDGAVAVDARVRIGAAYADAARPTVSASTGHDA